MYIPCLFGRYSEKTDEVWQPHEFKDEGKALACVCKLEKDRMVFKSWYELKNPKVRSGILIFRK